MATSIDKSGKNLFVTEMYGDVTDKDFFDRIFGAGNLFMGGPTCRFHNEEIPCMLRWTSKGNITFQILAESLQGTDSYNVFMKGKMEITPFPLFDGH